MIFDVYERLSKPSARVVCEIEAAPPEGLGAPCVGPVHGRVQLTNAGHEIIARGEVTAIFELECRRCLRRFQQTVTATINEPCALREIDQLEAYMVATDEPEALPILEGQLINLGELVRQNLVVALPARPLCKLDCRGLCPYCGKDLNEGPCECAEEQIDPRLAPLRALLDQHKDI